jgi:hypothetical protein
VPRAGFCKAGHLSVSPADGPLFAHANVRGKPKSALGAK